MSFDNCKDCGAFVNTDDDPDAYVEVGDMRRQTETICLCHNCRYEREVYAEIRAAQEAEMMAELERRQRRDLEKQFMAEHFTKHPHG